MKKTLIFLILALAFEVQGQTSPNQFWHLSSFNKKFESGIGFYEAQALVKDQINHEIIVAVIDNGVDVNHPDLLGQLWINEDEIPNNGIDDDKNGYIDDIHGWSFIGGPDGSVTYDNLELTRQYKILNEKYEFTNASEENPLEFGYYQELKKEFLFKQGEAKAYFELLSQIKLGIISLEEVYGDDITYEELKEHKSASREEEMARFSLMFSQGTKDKFNYKEVRSITMDEFEHFEYEYKYAYNTDFDPRAEIVGDNYNDGYQKNYGNNEIFISKKFSSHGTHVAGIIAANNENSIGAKGICQNAKIMVLRCVPEGDERDKDVANSIIYACDNGAKIINMSFGKSYVHQAEVIQKAIAYAENKGVLLVHAAGNEAQNNDVEGNYPNDFKGQFQNIWIEVGASSWEKRPKKLAEFSNYGQSSVDVFAPGVEIYSTTPDNSYEAYDGTSMASPVVSGVAAFVWSYYPEFTAQELRDILLESAVDIKWWQKAPGQKKRKRACKLSSTGAEINLHQALLLAKQRSKNKV